MERNQISEKIIQITQELCAGCGSCIDVCSAGAIHLVNHVAEIDDDLCIACEVCLENCPNGAFIAITAPVYTSPITAQAVIVPGSGIGQQPTTPLETAVPARGLKPLAGAALAFLGSEVAPRLVDVLIKSIETKLAQPTATSISPSISSSRDYSLQNRGQRKHIRHCGGRSVNRKYKGRR